MADSYISDIVYIYLFNHGLYMTIISLCAGKDIIYNGCKMGFFFQTKCILSHQWAIIFIDVM